MIFYVTERGTFHRCPRQAWLTSKNGLHLTPIMQPLALSVGSIMARAHQLWLEQPDVSLHEHAMQASDELLSKVKQRYERQIGTRPSEAELEETYQSIHMALAMAGHYAAKYGSPLPDGYDLVNAEQKIQVPIPGTEHFLEGRFDALLRHKSGRLDIFEQKTYKNRPVPDALQRSDQYMRAYPWMLLQVYQDSMPCVLYDGQWRRDEIPRGRTFDDLFFRTLLIPNRSVLDEFERVLPIEASEMARMYQNPAQYAYPVIPWQGCWDCKMDGGVTNKGRLCSAMSRSEDTELIKNNYYTQRDDDVDDTATATDTDD